MDEQAKKTALRMIPYGLYVLTSKSKDGSELSAATVNWVTQAQFAGYYAAQDLGYYKAAGLDVTIKNGGPNIIPEQVVASGHAQFGIDWLPSLLAARDQGTPLVNIAQVFARSGMTQLTWKSSGINTIAKMKSKKVANWLGGARLPTGWRATPSRPASAPASGCARAPMSCRATRGWR